MRPKDALSGAGGARAAGGRDASGAAAFDTSVVASEKKAAAPLEAGRTARLAVERPPTRMLRKVAEACSRTATDSHAEKSGRGLQ